MYRSANRKILIMAVILGLVATYLFKGYLEALERDARAMAETLPVVVASRDVPAGTVITEEMLRVESWPRETVHPQSFSDPAAVAGDIAAVDLIAGEPVLRGRLEDGDNPRTFAYRIPEGKRAVTIAVSGVSSVAGLVLPGDRVDVMATAELEGQKVRTVILLQNVEVLATGQEHRPGTATSYDSVTLALSPPEVQRLLLAEAKGSLVLSLRSPLDRKVTGYPVLSEGDVFGGEPDE